MLISCLLLYIESHLILRNRNYNPRFADREPKAPFNLGHLSKVTQLATKVRFKP